MPRKLAKANLHHQNDFRGETLEQEETTVQCTACLKTSCLNVARRIVDGGGDPDIVNGILDLPVHIIFDIFSRLPLKQVFMCRPTCKTFRCLLSQPNYGVLSLDKAQPCLLLREFSRRRYRKFFNRKAYVSDLAAETPSTFFYSKAYLVDLEETTCCPSPVNSSVNFYSLVKHEIFSLPAGKLELVGSCNGLVCLHQKERAQYYICNPLLGEWTILPSPSYESTNAVAIYSMFGFCPNLKQYKVIRFISSSLQLSLSATVEIITVGTSSWRYIGKGPRPKPRGSFSPSSVGDIIFTIDPSSGSTIICAFNLKTEIFHLVPSPPHFSPDYLLNISWVNVGLLHNSLCICYIHNESTFQIWTSDNNVTNPTWSRKSSGPALVLNAYLQSGNHHPSGFLDNNYNIWIYFEGIRRLFSFHPQESVQAFRVPGDDSSTGFQFVAHIPSFIRLQDALMPTDSTVETTIEVFHYGYKLWSH